MNCSPFSNPPPSSSPGRSSGRLWASANTESESGSLVPRPLGGIGSSRGRSSFMVILLAASDHPVARAACGLIVRGNAPPSRWEGVASVSPDRLSPCEVVHTSDRRRRYSLDERHDGRRLSVGFAVRTSSRSRSYWAVVESAIGPVLLWTDGEVEKRSLVDRLARAVQTAVKLLTGPPGGGRYPQTV